MRWSELFKNLDAFFYADSILILLSLSASIIGLIHFRKLKPLRLLIYYSLFSVAQGITAELVIAMPLSQETSNQGNASINSFMLIEFLLLYAFLFKNIRLKAIRIMMVINSVIFVGLAVWLFLTDFAQPLDTLMVLEAIFIILACIGYFFSLLRHPPLYIPTKDPNIWVCSGILLLFNLIIPFTLVAKYAMEDLYLNSVYSPVVNTMYTTIIVGYIIFFIFILIAFRCQIKIPE